MRLKRNIFHQPFPLNTKIHRKFIVAARFGLFIIVFLLLFKPFQLDTLDSRRFITYCIAYGVMTFLCIIFMVVLVPLIFPSFLNLYRVKEVIGNAQEYKIKLQEVDEMIPVSRNLNSEFSDKLLSNKFMT